ncbi:MAG: hypothetical protein LUH47_04925 [Clostridiales bacterium]|nr:hypothetical protein [Clostridiales bacterium]
MKKQIISAFLITALTFGSGSCLTVFGSDAVVRNINTAITSVEDEDGQIDIESADEHKVVFYIGSTRYVYLFDGTEDEILEAHIIDTDHEFDEDDYDIYFIDDDFEYEDYEYDSEIDYDSLIGPYEALEAAEEETDLSDDEEIVAKTAGLVWTEEGDELIYDVHILTDEDEEYNYEIKAYTGAVYEEESYSTNTAAARAKRSEARRYYYSTNSSYNKRKYKYERPVIIVVNPPEDKPEPPKDEPEQPEDGFKPGENEPEFRPEAETRPEPESFSFEEPSTEETTESQPEIPTFEPHTNTPHLEIPTETATSADETVTKAAEVTTEEKTETTTAELPTQTVTAEPKTETTTETPVIRTTERVTQKTTEKAAEKATQKITERPAERATQKTVIEPHTETTTLAQRNGQFGPQQNNRGNMNDMPFRR